MTSIIRFSYFFLLLALTVIGTSCSNSNQSGMESEEIPASRDSVSSTYNSELAEELGADNYGMRQYVIAFLKTGPNPSTDSTRAMELQRAHMNNISRMAEEGDLVLAGPFLDNGELRGIYVFDVKTVEEARELTETDPAVQAGAFEMELHPWYGSAALMQINEIHGQISKENP